MHSTGVFELYLAKFENSKGVNSDGNCCNGFLPGTTKCTASCRTFFRICWTHYQAQITDEVHCSYAEETTPVLGDNDVNFQNLPVKFENPIRFPFQFSWPVSLFDLHILFIRFLASSCVPLTCPSSHNLPLLWWWNDIMHRTLWCHRQPPHPFSCCVYLLCILNRFVRL